MRTHTFTINWQSGSEALSYPVVVTADGETNGDYPVAAGVVNWEIDIAFVKTLLQSILITSDVAATLKTNSTSTPQETITLAPGIPFFWFIGSGLVNPFVGNVTKFYANVPGGAAGNIKIRTLQDTTP
jgi:hypothetical protein